MIAGLPYDSEVEYLETDGACYFDTGIIVGSPLRVECDYYLPGINKGTIWGAYRRSSMHVRMTGGTSSGNRAIAASYNGTAMNVSSTAETPYYPYRATAVFNGDAGAQSLVAFGTSTQVTNSDGLGSVGAKLGIFCQGRYNGTFDSLSGSGVRIYSWKCWIGGILASDIIPVVVKTAGGDREGAMYDRVSRTVLRNQGSGTPMLGPDKPIPIMGLHFMRRPRYTAKDYVQDGLVAMWDGIENAGWGTHDPNATTWRNLAGDSRLDLNITGMVVGDDYIDTNKLTSKTQYILPQTDFTIEIVGASIKKTSWAQIEYWLSYESDGSMPLGFGPSGSWNNMLFYRYGTTAGKSNCSSYDSKGNFTVLNGWSGSSHSSGSQPVLYKNGVQLPFSTWIPRQGNFSASQFNALGIGVKMWSNGSVVSNTNSMKLCEVRFYNRVLTAEEITHNCAVDKERFNLP